MIKFDKECKNILHKIESLACLKCETCDCDDCNIKDKITDIYSNIIKQYQQGRKDEQDRIIEIIDNADDSYNAMFLLSKYLIEEKMRRS